MSDPSGMVSLMEEAMNDEFPEVRVAVSLSTRTMMIRVDDQRIHVPGFASQDGGQQIFAAALAIAHIRPCEYALRFLDSESSRRFAPLYRANDPSYKEVCAEWVMMRAEFAARCRKLKLPTANTPAIRALAKAVGDFEKANALLQEECTRFRLEQEASERVSIVH